MSHKIESIQVGQGAKKMGGSNIFALVTTADGAYCKVVIPSKNMFYYCDGIKCFDELSMDLSEELSGEEIFNQGEIDFILAEFEENDVRFDGLNGMPSVSLAISLAVMKLGARLKEIPIERYIGGLGVTSFPLPCMNMISTGKDAFWESSYFKEYTVIPKVGIDWEDFFNIGEKVHKELGVLLQERSFVVNLKDDGSFIPILSSNQHPLELLTQAIEKAGYVPGDDVLLGINAAAGELYSEGFYKIDKKGTLMESSAMVNYYDCLNKEFSLHMIMNGFARDNVSGMKEMQERLGGKVRMVGDDLLHTNSGIVCKDADPDLAKATTIYPYSLKSVSQISAAVKTCRDKNWTPFL